MNALTDFLQTYGSDLWFKSLQHLQIALTALGLGILVAVPLAIILTRLPKRVSGLVIGFASVLQTVPSLAILAFMIPFFGIGKTPAILALFIYSLLPILRNTYVGMKNIDFDLKDAAKGMGMTTFQSIIKVELPNAVVSIMSGIRLSAVYVIAWTTLSSYIGAGGLGDFIFSGLNLYNVGLIIGGTVPIVLMALGIDFLLGQAEHFLTPIPQRGGAS